MKKAEFFGSYCFTVSQNLHKLSKLRVFPDFDLKFLCQFFVL